MSKVIIVAIISLTVHVISTCIISQMDSGSAIIAIPILWCVFSLASFAMSTGWAIVRWASKNA